MAKFDLPSYRGEYRADTQTPKGLLYQLQCLYQGVPLQSPSDAKKGPGLCHEPIRMPHIPCCRAQLQCLHESM